MAPNSMRVSVIAGRFASKGALQAYVAESAAEDGSPRSAFLDDFGRAIGSTDLIEIHFQERPTRDLGELLAGCSWASEYESAAASDWSGDLAVNAVILGIWLGESTPALPARHDPGPPRPHGALHIRRDDHEVRFVGAYGAGG